MTQYNKFIRILSFYFDCYNKIIPTYLFASTFDEIIPNIIIKDHKKHILLKILMCSSIDAVHKQFNKYCFRYLSNVREIKLILFILLFNSILINIILLVRALIILINIFSQVIILLINLKKYVISTMYLII